MGQKVHPLGFRLGVSQKHISHWFIENNHYSQLVVEDQFIRNFFYKKFPGIASINIKRDLNRIVIEILSANTRDLLMEGGKMTAKATVSFSSQVNINSAVTDNPQVGEQNSVHSDQTKLPQNIDLDSSDPSQTQKLGQQKVKTSRVEKTSSFTGGVGGAKNSVNNLCDQLLKELTVYRDTRLKKKIKLKWNKSQAIPSGRVQPGLQKREAMYAQARPMQTEEFSSDRENFDNVSAPDKTASVSLKNKESEIDLGKDKTLSAPIEYNPPTESGMVKKTVYEKAPLLHEIELFWTKVENPNTSAACLAEFIVEQLEKRVPFRRVLKRSIQKAEESSVEGIKVQISGRLNGAEIARSERIHKGQVPLHTLRAKIEYNSRTAKTIYGLLGVKVWVFNGFADLNQTKLLT